MIDRYDHEMDIIDDSIKKLQLSRDRYQQLEQENEVIQGSLINLRQKMSADSTQHGMSPLCLLLTPPHPYPLSLFFNPFFSCQPKKFMKSTQAHVS
jgi:hypothetical protein